MQLFSAIEKLKIVEFQERVIEKIGKSKMEVPVVEVEQELENRLGILLPMKY